MKNKQYKKEEKVKGIMYIGEEDETYYLDLNGNWIKEENLKND